MPRMVADRREKSIEAVSTVDVILKIPVHFTGSHVISRR